MEAAKNSSVPESVYPGNIHAQPGAMPSVGYLGQAYVPVQKNGPTYTTGDGLMIGTLFPGLNLPYKNIANTKDVANTPLGEIQALDFAVSELGLYLDTHPNDADAIKLRNSYVMLLKDGTKQYEKQYGPLSSDVVMDGKYNWISSPWPWEAAAPAQKNKKYPQASEMPGVI